VLTTIEQINHQFLVQLYSSMSNQDNVETGETTAADTGSSPSPIGSDRLSLWLALCIFSATAVAELETNKGFFSDNNTTKAVALALASSSIALSFLGFVLSIVKRGVFFVGKLGEVTLVVVLLGVWGAGRL